MVHLILFPLRFFLLLCVYIIFHHFPDIKIEGVLWYRYISCYHPCEFIFSLSRASVYFSTTSRILKLEAFRGASHIIPPAKFFGSCASTYFSTTFWMLKLKSFRGTSHIFPPANFFLATCSSIYFYTTSWMLKLRFPWYISYYSPSANFF